MEANDGRQAQGAYIPQELLKEISKVNNRLLIGIPRERCEAEKRLPLTPEAVDMLTDCGHRVLVESGAGLGINYSDNHFSEAGAEIVDTPAEVFPAVVIIGAGNAGTVAARAALALGASVKVFDDDINKLRIIQQVLGQGLFTSTFHPNVLHNAFRSADVVIGAMRYINTRHRYIIATDLVRTMKKGALVIDLRVSQGGCFETTCCLSREDPAVFEQYGVLHYCKLNISNRVARTTSMAYSNIFVPLLLSLGDAGSVQGMIKSDKGFRAGVYMYYGKTVNSYVSNHFNLSSNNLDLYLSAF